MSHRNPYQSAFYFNYRSILVSPGKALTLKKVFIGALVCAVAGLVYGVFTLGAFYADGRDGWEELVAYDYFPLTALSLVSVISRALHLLGILFSLAILTWGAVAISVIAIEELRGHRLCSARAGLKFARSRMKCLLFALAGMGAFVLLGALALSLFGLLGRIPIIGESVVALGFVIPGFVIALILTFVSFVACASLLIMPAVIAADRVGESFTAILETFSTLLREPARWVGYTLLSLALAKVCVWLLAYASVFATTNLAILTSASGGQEIGSALARALAQLPTDSPLVRFLFTLYPGVGEWGVISIEPILALGGAAQVSSVAVALMGISSLAIFYYILGYGYSIVATAQAYAFVITKRARDKYDITTEEPLLFAPASNSTSALDGVEFRSGVQQEQSGSDTTDMSVPLSDEEI